MGKLHHLLTGLLASGLVLSCGGVVKNDDDADTPDVVPDEATDAAVDPTDDPAADPVPDGTDPDLCVLVIVEAESFTTNEFWAVCPGAGCEDDMSSTASGGGHLLTHEDHFTSDPAGAIQTTVPVPRRTTWYAWARSVRGGPNRTWEFGINGTVSTIAIGAGEPVWEFGGAFEVDTDNVMIAIRDAAPDAYWAYPDAIILSIVDTFDPNLCAGDGYEASHCLCD